MFLLLYIWIQKCLSDSTTASNRSSSKFRVYDIFLALDGGGQGPVPLKLSQTNATNQNPPKPGTR